LKAYLCANGLEVPKTHEVELLCHRCNEINPAFSTLYDDCQDLQVYATGTRYPNRIEVSEQDAKQALQQANTIYQLAKTQIAVDPPLQLNIPTPLQAAFKEISPPVMMKTDA